MPSLETIARAGFPVRTGDNEHADAFFGNLRSVVVGYQHDVQAARENPALTDIGRRERIAEVARAANAKIEALVGGDKNAVDIVGARVAELRGRARVHEPKSPEGANAELQAREIRDHIRSLPSHEHKNLLANAVERGDEATFAAVINDPLRRAAPIIGDDMIDRFRSAWVAQRAPELAEAITNQSALHESMTSLAKSTQNAIAADAGVEPTLRERIGAA